MIIPKFIAFYFPQFHSIPENNEWWGPGFTDWDLVKGTKPLYDGHNQPKVPMEDHYYNPCAKGVLQQQAKLAKEYGIDGFMFYHYWFDGKLLLEKPLELLRDNKDIDISYCLCWANESWSRAWVSKPKDILVKQNHTADQDLWLAHFNYLLPFLKDERAIKKQNKPVIIIYQPQIIVESDAMIAYWRKLAIENGLDGLYVIANKSHSYINDSFLKSYDGLLKFQPREASTSKFNRQRSIVDRYQILRALPNGLINLIRRFRYKMMNYTIFDSNAIWKVILDRAYKNDHPNYNIDIYESGFFEWDNTSRYKDKAKIYTSLSRSEKRVYLEALMNKAKSNNSEYIFWNAWNEWSEGSYLEPDTFSGYESLEVVKEVFKK